MKKSVGNAELARVRARRSESTNQNATIVKLDPEPVPWHTKRQPAAISCATRHRHPSNSSNNNYYDGDNLFIWDYLLHIHHNFVPLTAQTTPRTPKLWKIFYCDSFLGK